MNHSLKIYLSKTDLVLFASLKEETNKPYELRVHRYPGCPKTRSQTPVAAKAGADGY